MKPAPIALAVDLNGGSLSRERKEYLPHIRQVLRQAGGRLRVLLFGQDVCFDRAIESTEELPLHRFVMGSDCRRLLDHLTEKGSLPQALLVLSDLDGITPLETPDLRILWLKSRDYDITVPAGRVMHESVMPRFDVVQTALRLPPAPECQGIHLYPPVPAVLDTSGDLSGWQQVLRREGRDLVGRSLADSLSRSARQRLYDEAFRDFEREMRGGLSTFRGTMAHLEGLIVLDVLAMRGFRPPRRHLEALKERARESATHANLLLRIAGIRLRPELLQELWGLHPESDASLRAALLSHPAATPELWLQAARDLAAPHSLELRAILSRHNALTTLVRNVPAMARPEVAEALLPLEGDWMVAMAADRVPDAFWFRYLSRILETHPNGAMAVAEKLRQASPERLRSLEKAEWAWLLAHSRAEVRLRAVAAQARAREEAPAPPPLAAQGARRQSSCAR